MTPINETAARGFVDGDLYERGRASYPEGIVDAIGIAAETRVADVGCGTGKFTRMIAHARTVGVEPLPAMRETFARVLPDVPLVAGVAEAMPFRDRSLDVTSFASAFHWLDHERALPELHRVLEPGGKLAIIWNRRDELSGWAAEFWQLTEAHRGETPGYRTSGWREALERSSFFGPIDEHWFDHVQRTDLEGVLARVASASFVEISPQRDEILAQCREFLETHPATTGRDEIDLPYRSVVYVCENRPHA